MRNSKSIMLVVCVLANVASAELIRGIEIEFVTIGNAGNAADTQVMNDGTTGYGAVGYEYRIGKYETKTRQWDAFIPIAGAPIGNPVGAYDVDSIYQTPSNSPVSNVSWFEALQFCNWLTSGDKSQGAYQFSGNNANPGDFLGIDRDFAILTYEDVYVIPTEDEWYKAAYYTGSGYSLYANGLDTIPAADNGWNYYGGEYNQPWGEGPGAEEQNGTFNMMGNVEEWTEALYSEDRHSLRGGCLDYQGPQLASSFRPNHGFFDYERTGTGFRIASVPEPATLCLLALGVMVLRKNKPR